MADVGTTEGLWRDGAALVMHREAKLPALCVKTGEPAATTISQKLAWYPRWIGLLVLLGLAGVGIIPFLIVATVFTKRATIDLPLGEATAKRRRRAVTIGWAVGMLGLAATVGGLVVGFAAHREILFALSFVGFLVALVGLAVGLRGTSIVTPQRITDQHVWLVGVSPTILEALPDWSIRTGTARTWDFSVPAAGARILARLDADGTESVYLGPRLVSRAAPGAKPDGHVVTLGPQGAYRGGGVARVVFSPSLGACAMDVDGAAVAPSPYGSGPIAAPSRVAPLAAVGVTALALLGVAALVVGARAKVRGASLRTPPLSPDLAMTYASKDGAITVHYPRELAADPVGNEGIKLEQAGGSTVLVTSIPTPITKDSDELLRIVLDAIRHEGMTIEETWRGDGMCHDQSSTVVDGKFRVDATRGQLHACAFRGGGRAFVMLYAVPDGRAGDEPILKRIVDGADIPSLPARAPSGLALPSAAPEPTPAPKPVEGEPLALAACTGSELTCSTDGKNLVQCQSGRPLLIERPCLGPKGCSMTTGMARCDESISRVGDSCAPRGRIACSEDGKYELTCTTLKEDETPTSVTPGAGPAWRSRRPLPTPPARATSTKPKPPGSLVWTRPRLCTTACAVRDGRIECD